MCYGAYMAFTDVNGYGTSECCNEWGGARLLRLHLQRIF